MGPVRIGSLAAEAVEPRQGRKAAALRRFLWVTRKTWLSSAPWTYPIRVSYYRWVGGGSITSGVGPDKTEAAASNV